MPQTIAVLYVDDEAALLDIGKLFLERLGGLSVEVADSAPHAIEMMKSRQFDVLVSDYQMPGMSGIEFLKYIRTRSNIPFILFTGKGREEVVIEAINNGVDFYLQKGGDPRSQFTELAHKIRQAVSKRQAEKSLRDSQQNLSDIIEFLPDATFAIDRNGIVLVWNRAMEAMTGIPAKDMVGKGNFEYAIPFYKTRRPILIDLVLANYPISEAQYPYVIREGKKLISEIFIPHFAGGKGMYLWFTSSPLYDTEGTIIGAIESIRDVTERKRTQEALLVAEQKFSKVFLSSPDMISISELESGKFIDVNDASSRILGYTKEEMIGKNVWDLGIWFHAEDRHALIKKLDAGERVQDLEAIQRRKSGELFPAAVSAETITLKTTPCLLTVVRDITERKQAGEALRLSEERYRSVVEEQTEFISRFTPDGIHVFANDAYLHYFNLTRENLIGHLFTPSIPDEDKKSLGRHFASLTIENPSASIEHRIIMPDGQVRWQQWSDRAIFNDNGEIIEYQSVGRDITDKKQREEELRAAYEQLAAAQESLTSQFETLKKSEDTIRTSEHFLNSVFSSIQDGLSILDTEMKVVRVNPTIEHLYAHEMPLVGRKCFEVYHRRSGRCEICPSYECLQTGKPAYAQVPLVVDGKPAGWLDLYSFPMRDLSTGKITGVIEYVRDISEKKKAQEALALAEQEWERIFQAIGQPTIIVDPGHNILAANVAVLKASGMTQATITGKKCYEVFHEKDMTGPPAGCPIEKLKTSTHVETMEMEMETLGGIYLISCTPIFNEEGKISKVIHIATDITERKQAELDLAESEAFNRSLVENLPDYITVYDMSGKVVYVNPAGAKMMGCSPESLIGTPILSYIAEYDRDHARQALELRTAGVKVDPYELDVIGRNQEIISVALKGVPITYHNQPAVLLLLNDITERLKAEQELYQANRAINEANKKLNLLSNITRHDIVNKLHILRGFLELARTSSDASVATGYLSRIDDAARAIEEQIQFTRDYEELGVSAPVWQDVEEMVNRAITSFNVQGIAVNTDLGGAEIFADPMLGKVFSNLIDNSLNYGEKVTRISFFTCNNNEERVLVYEDDGAGISDQEKLRIFERGYGKQTGLGLFLSREILSITGIRIKENGIPGKGAHFEILVPREAWRVRIS